MFQTSGGEKGRQITGNPPQIGGGKKEEPAGLRRKVLAPQKCDTRMCDEERMDDQSTEIDDASNYPDELVSRGGGRGGGKGLGGNGGGGPVCRGKSVLCRGGRGKSNLCERDRFCWKIGLEERKGGIYVRRNCSKPNQKGRESPN